MVLGWGLFTCNAPGAPLGLLLSRLFIPQGGVSALYFLRNYAVLLVVCCVCSTQLPGRFWQWCKGKAPLRAALCGVCFVLCTAYVVAATGSNRTVCKLLREGWFYGKYVYRRSDRHLPPASLIVFAALLCGFALVNLFWPKRENSELENRKLAQMPVFSVKLC